MEATVNKVLLLLGVIIILTGCTPAGTPVETVETMPPPATEAPTAVPGWQVIATSTYKHAVSYAGFMDGSFGITVGYAGEIHYTTDGGATWPMANNTSWCRFGLEIVDDQVAWHCGNGGHVRKSTDGGRTWKVVTDFGGNEPNHCRFLSFLDDTTGWAATPSQLAVTNDGGETWQEIALPDGIGLVTAIELLTPQTGYLLGSNGNLYVTTDGGQSWTVQALDFMKNAFIAKMPSPLAAMRFTDAKHGMVVLPRGNADDGFYLWSAYTEDGGQTWQEDQVPVDRGIPYLYLSRDASTLTVLNSGLRKIVVVQFQQGAD
jgi:photosystem II stability/assembly factor-like uncharacterized protein